jgi:hypothetical protein
LTFWLGGMPNWQLDNNGNPILPSNTNPPFNPMQPVRGFLGFSANPQNPFDNGQSRISPFFDFDPQRFYGLWYWPKQADGSKRPGTAATPLCPIVYFRAENSNYTADGLPFNGNTNNTTNLKGVGSRGLGLVVFPAIDTRTSTITNKVGTTTYTWVNPSSIQILCSGLDLKYGSLGFNGGSSNPLTWSAPLRYPAQGVTLPTLYPSQTFDDITNFSGGALEDSK